MGLGKGLTDCRNYLVDILGPAGFKFVNQDDAFFTSFTYRERSASARTKRAMTPAGRRF